MPDDEKKFTQADVDRIVSERLARDRETRGDPTVLLSTITDLKGQIGTLTSRNTELEGKVNGNERTAILSRVALDLKLPLGLAEFVQGNTEEEMKASAQKLYAGIGPAQGNVGGGTNPPGSNTAPLVYTKDMLKGMSPEQINKDWANISTQLKAGQVK